MVSSAAPRFSPSVRASAAEAFLAHMRWLAEHIRMPDARSRFVQAVLLQHLDAQVNERGGQEVVHQGDRLAVGQPDPLQRVHQRPLGQLQRGRDPVVGVA